MIRSALPNFGFVEFVQNTSWVIPAVQSIHILAIGLLFATISLVNLNRAEIFAPDVKSSQMGGGRLKFGLGALSLLATTGVIMVVSEPARTLGNPLFYVKLGMVSFACLLTFAPPQFCPAITLKTRAYLTLLTWALIIFAGRWIAYVI